MTRREFQLGFFEGSARVLLGKAFTDLGLRLTHRPHSSSFVGLPLIIGF